MDHLLEMMAALDRVGVAHCNVSEESVLCRVAEGGQLELKLVNFELSTTDVMEKASGRGFWPAVQNLDMHMVAKLVWELVTGEQYDFQPELLLPDGLKTMYSKDTQDLLRKLHRFHRVAECFHASGPDDDEAAMRAEMRVLRDMELTPMNVLRVWKGRSEVGGVLFKVDLRRLRQEREASGIRLLETLPTRCRLASPP